MASLESQTWGAATPDTIALVNLGELFPREYQSWRGARGRCRNTNHQKYARYGGRGITMCAAWQDNFASFLRDMGPRPEGCSLNRINNDGNYEPGNCNWATQHEQQRNRGTNRHITFNGRTQVLTDWAVEVGIGDKGLNTRLDLGWTIERALTTPAATHGNHMTTAERSAMSRKCSLATWAKRRANSSHQTP